MTSAADVRKRVSGRVLTFLLVVALLLCHGALGAVHQVSWPASTAQAHHAVVTDDAAASQEHSQEHPQDHRGEHPINSSDYAATLFTVLLLGTVLTLFLSGARMRGPTAGLITVGRICPPPVLPPSRGHAAPFLQVFRL